MKKHLKLLGLTVEDKVTGFKGVATSISFDLYGCVQVIINPYADDSMRLVDSRWFDISRVVVIDSSPVMEQPNFVKGDVADGKKGPAEKPAF